MKLSIRIVKWGFALLSTPVFYFVISLLLSSITIDRKADGEVKDKSIYLTTNGVHLDIVLPIKTMDTELLSNLKYESTDHYLSFGWGDENFYINTPTWGDLTFDNAFTALFLKSSTLMHVTRYRYRLSNWIEIKVSEPELTKLNTYIQLSFQTSQAGKKILLENQGYSSIDNFYKAKGSYSCFKTCNSWVNTGFLQSGLKACLWTPFDFGLMDKYKNEEE
ncbi:DUF2459 domain-containing protein [Flammeovirga sp. OC4]|uniref:DUF2459 domain-containing protein n=1 Tax=Flammeovirga sp. OC4 TaxID=1382345 RepID=UPI0005C5A9BD|nr:DUF2459 domain-containing protein [Flammeovirga sp. OC4]